MRMRNLISKLSEPKKDQVHTNGDKFQSCTLMKGLNYIKAMLY